jgi:TolA-binding protein
LKARGIRRAQASLAVLLLLSASFAGAEPYAGRPTFQDAVALFYAGEYARSRDAFEAFLTLQPRSPLRNRVPYWLGAISLGMGDYDSALEGFNRAAFDGEDPPFYPWHSKLLAGIALEELGREGEAAALYRALQRWSSTVPIPLW